MTSIVPTSKNKIDPTSKNKIDPQKLIGIETNIESLQRKPSLPTPSSQKAKGPVTMSVQGGPSGTDSSFRNDFTKTLNPQPLFGVKGTSSRAATALKKAPTNPQGSTVKLSDRHSLCISPRGPEVAVGSSDNAVYVVNVHTAKFVRTLGGRTCGHAEWVTCVQFMDDGRILSGGMDSKLCLWEKNAVKCSNLIGHGSAISECSVLADCTIGLSSSYDKTIKLWDLGDNQRGTISCLGTLKGHKGPVTKLISSAQQTNFLSGSMNGEVILWDAVEGRSLVRCVDAHDGQVTAVLSMIGGNTPQREAAGTGEMFLTGGQDGVLQVWDFRVQAGPVVSAKAHRTYKGCPVAFIGVSHKAAASSALVVTAGGDKTLKVLDPRASFQVVHTIKDHTDNITCLLVRGGLAWSGAADGRVLLHEAVTGECLYGLKAVAKGGVRCLCLAGDNKLAVAGDDGNLLVYSH